MKRRSLDVILVFRAPGDGRRGRVRAGALDLPCALGSGGLVVRKREGDGGTPRGRLRVLGVLYRPDRGGRPATTARLTRIGRDDGWCDDPASRLYNRPLRLPSPLRHERLWRDDPLYDLVVDLDWNRGPARPGRGSAIFLHAARPGFTPTEGCVAVDRRVLARLVGRIGSRTVIRIGR